VIGTFVMRSAGCVMNDFADPSSTHVKRTADRHSRNSRFRRRALGLFAVLGLIGSRW